jgi:multidrug efflux pump subunit AcrA (membrane-fusion protein)
LAPLRTDLEVSGVVEIIQRSDVSLDVQRGYLRFLLKMCELAADFLKSRQLRHFSDRQVLWSRLEDFSRAVHGSLEPLETAYTIANEGRRLIECDRLSVAINKGRKCRIEAVSGQDVFDKRSNTVRLLARLATAVVATGDPIWYTGDTQDMAPQVEEAVQEYVDESHSKIVAVLPLGRPRLDEEDDPRKRLQAEPPIGALIVEQIEDRRLAPSMVQRVEVVCRHSSTALANALEHQNLFLMPLWRLLGKARWIVSARTLPKTISIAAAVLVLLVGLALWPVDFQVQSKGTLEPVERCDVFARVDGVVLEPPAVDNGVHVKKDEVLVRLRNTEAQMALAQVEGQLRVSEQSIDSLQRMLLSGQLKPDDYDKRSGELAEERKKLANLQGQYKLCQQKIKDLDICSPIDGVVVSFDAKKDLINRPVQRGQKLMRVADLRGPWQLELHMPEDRMGFIAAAQEKLRQENAAGGKDEKLQVTYILATEPGTQRHGTVCEIASSAEIYREEGNTVLIKVKIDKNQLPQLTPGASVTAKIYCGRRPIGYVLFHDLIAFIQSRILFRF